VLKRLVPLLLLLLSSALCLADGERSITFSVASSDITLNLSGSGISASKITWSSIGSAPSVCTIALDSSVDGLTWSAGTAISNQTCTSNGNSSIITGVFSFVRITLVSFTGSGTLTVKWNGYVNPPSVSGTGVNAQQVQGVETNNAPPIGKTFCLAWDATNCQRILTDTTGRLITIPVLPSYTFSNINGASTGTVVKATAGILHSVAVNTEVANATIRVLNLASAGCTGSPTTPTIALITLPATISNPVSQIYDISASAGICVVASGATDVTVAFQ